MAEEEEYIILREDDSDSDDEDLGRQRPIAQGGLENKQVWSVVCGCGCGRGRMKVFPTWTGGVDRAGLQMACGSVPCIVGVVEVACASLAALTLVHCFTQDLDDLFSVEEAVEDVNFMAVKPWKGAIKAPTNAPKGDMSAPNQTLELEWAYGYRCHDSRSNLVYNSAGNMVYPVAGVCVTFSSQKNEQVHFRGHNDDVISLAQHPTDKDIIATGQVCAMQNFFLALPRPARPLCIVRCCSVSLCIALSLSLAVFHFRSLTALLLTPRARTNTGGHHRESCRCCPTHLRLELPHQHRAAAPPQRAQARCAHARLLPRRTLPSLGRRRR